jgi:hypothetical protein
MNVIFSFTITCPSVTLKESLGYFDAFKFKVEN